MHFTDVPLCYKQWQLIKEVFLQIWSVHQRNRDYAYMPCYNVKILPMTIRHKKFLSFFTAVLCLLATAFWRVAMLSRAGWKIVLTNKTETSWTFHTGAGKRDKHPIIIPSMMARANFWGMESQVQDCLIWTGDFDLNQLNTY